MELRRMELKDSDPHPSPWQERLHEIIFEADTPRGKTFDLLLILAILTSVGIVLLDSIEIYNAQYGPLFHAAELFFTLVFTIEYILRLSCLRQPRVYAFSFFGVVDLISFLPTYISLLLPGTQYLLVIRILRILRVFRVLKLAQYVGESEHLLRALKASRRKISVFVYAILTLVVIFGSLVYLVEGKENGFTSIPVSIYWAIVTMTTVGYGDLAPVTPLGKVLASIIMVFGYGIIAVPTGIVTVEMAHARAVSTQACRKCGREGHDQDASHCKFCGAPL
jgi:voltage-gated potassium channel